MALFGRYLSLPLAVACAASLALAPSGAGAKMHTVQAPNGYLVVGDVPNDLPFNCRAPAGDRVIYVFPGDWSFVELGDARVGAAGGNYACYRAFLTATYHMLQGTITLAFTPPSCGGGDVPVWVDVKQGGNVYPLSATAEINKTDGGYACASTLRGKPFKSWDTSAHAECGGDDVIAFSTTNFAPGTFYPGNSAAQADRFACRSLLTALGWTFQQRAATTGLSAADALKVKLGLTAAQQPCSGDVAVWVATNVVTVYPATATLPNYPGGYSCAKAQLQALGQQLRLVNWSHYSDAQCGGGGVAAYDSFHPGYYKTAVPNATFDMNTEYMCQPLLAALGWKLSDLTASTTPPNCTAPDVAVAVSNYKQMVPLSAASVFTSPGYSCALQAQAANYSLYGFSAATNAQCGGAAVAAYNAGTKQFYEPPDAAYSTSSSFECEPLLTALGYTKGKSGTFVLSGPLPLTLAATPPSCTAPDVPVWISLATKTMSPLTATDVVGKGDGGYTCAAAPYRSDSVAVQDWTSPSSAECGTGPIVAYKPGAGSYLDSTDPSFTAPGYHYTCRSLAAALNCSSSTWVSTLAGGIAIPKVVKCDINWIDAAYLADALTLNGAGSSGDCAPARYANYVFSLNTQAPPADFNRLKALVAASKACSDPWIGEAYIVDGPKRPPSAAECSADNYGPYNNSYARLQALITAYLAGTLGSGPSGKFVGYKARPDVPCNGPNQAAWVGSGKQVFVLDRDPDFGYQTGLYTCRDDATQAGLKLGAHFNVTPVNCPSPDIPVLATNDAANYGYYPQGTTGYTNKTAAGGYMCQSEAQQLGLRNLAGP
ncbi:MAG: hypothetical protein JOZ24_07400 [Candidatus Eremiobacteraeota bacterium]|nr:hypothetical protein [Candidatus Eremiobacteraeota bacterium]